MARYSRLLLLLLLLALFCAPLAIHIYLGSFSRLMADEFCMSATAHSYGIIRGALYWYFSWTGRFSANLLDNFFGYIGPSVIPYATGVAIITWLIVLTWTLAQLIPLQTERAPKFVFACLFAAMILFAVLDVVPLVGQSLYWFEEMRNVVPPLMLGTAYIGLLARQATATHKESNFVPLAIAALLTFIATGFAETYFAAQTTAIVFGLLLVPAAANRKRCFWGLVAGLAGSLMGGLIVFVAPGNKFRRSPFPPPPGPPELLTIAFRGLRDFFSVVVFSPPRIFTWAGIFLCAFVTGLVMSHHTLRSSNLLRRHVWTLVLLPLVTLVLLIACWVPMAYGTSLLLHYRTFIIPVYVLVLLTAYWAYVAGRVCATVFSNVRLMSTAVATIVFLAFALFALHTARKMFASRSSFASYAQAWDERDRTIKNAKAQGLTYVIVRPLHNSATIDEIELDPKVTWLTKCVQDHYGIAVVPQLGDLRGEPNGQTKQAELEQQFDRIQPVPGSTLAPLNEVYKTERGKVGFYNTDAPSDKIKSHYQTELARLGWKYIGEKKVETFQRFSGGTQTLFCHGDIGANLFITGDDKQRLGYTYSLALNWGMSSGYVWGKVDCPQ